jgi:hypothetical protein
MRFADSVTHFPPSSSVAFWQFQSNYPLVELTDALDLYADKVFIAKKLPNYPKTDRARSDDKRVEFWAKTMTGASLGIAPITAVKRLSHWHWPKDWVQQQVQEWREQWERTKP